MRIELTVNGQRRTLDVSPLARLLDLLRDDLGLTGTKEGCGEGECGACSVIMDGRVVASCLVPAMQAAGSAITTIEGIGTSAAPSRLQELFNEEGAIHCGFCTPGMIVAAQNLLERTSHPDERTIRQGLSGNICRCTGYGPIVRAVTRAASENYGELHRISRANLCPKSRPTYGTAERERFFSPRNLDEALAMLEDHPEARPLAGLTDLMVDLRNDRTPIDEAIDVFGLPELHVISQDESGTIRIGSCVTNAELIESPLVAHVLPALRTCALRCGAPAIQSRATIGGNLCTASGAGDLPVVLLALDASVLLASRHGETTMKTRDFVVRYRTTALEPGQLVKEILIPCPVPGSAQTYYKRGSRKALTLSRVSIAAYMERDGDRLSVLRLAAGAMSPIPRRLPETEAALLGAPIDSHLADRAAELAAGEIAPRRQTAYRKNITGNLMRRFFNEALGKRRS